jgi:UDP-arabinose 4-epimerase
MSAPKIASKPRVLVTGGAGYIGSHACRSLAEAGFEPVAYDNMVYGHSWAVQWGDLVEGDVTDRDKLMAVFEKYQPIAVMHFAGFAYVGESVSDPAKYYANNVSGGITLLTAMKDAGIKAFIFSSSCATYGIPKVLPLTEDHPQDPVSPYGQSKLMFERILADFNHAYGLRHMNLRYFNAAGASPDGTIGEDHDPETHLIPLILQAILGKRPPLQVFGTDYPTPDGTAIRDYIHVIDLADAHVLALNLLLDGHPGDSINLGTGRGYSVREVIETAQRITGKPVPHHDAPRRAGDPPELVADASKAASVLGFTPKMSDLDTIVKTAWNWHSKH